MSKRRKIIIIVLLVLAVAGLGWLYRGYDWFKPGPNTPQTSQNQAPLEIVAQNLTVPWEIAWLPDGDMLVTERPGTLKRIGANQQTYTIEGVAHVGEGGLMGMTLHPKFGDNGWLYLYLTTGNGEGLINRVERYRLEENQLADRQLIIGNIPGARIHDGGRLAFGPDGLLYITTGDAASPDSAQNTNSLAGKILRLTDDGRFPPDNPFGNAVYSYGHRNPQGIAWDNRDQLWAVEHGSTAYDELNQINRGANYGWPIVRGDQTQEGMVSPIVFSPDDGTWAPAGLAWWNASLWFSGLRGQTLYQAKIGDNNQAELGAHYAEQFGRLRAVAVGPDGWLYFSTSNTDGRGQPNAGDDKIIRINSRQF